MTQYNAQDAVSAGQGLAAPVWGSFLDWDARTTQTKRLIHVQVPTPSVWSLWLEYTCPQRVPVSLRIMQASGQVTTTRTVQILPGQQPIPVVGQTVIVDAFTPGTATGVVPVTARLTCAMTPGAAVLIPLAGTHGEVEQITPAIAPGTAVPGDIGVTRLIHNIGPGAVEYEITPGITSGRILANDTLNLPYTGPLVIIDVAGTAPTVNLTTIKA